MVDLQEPWALSTWERSDRELKLLRTKITQKPIIRVAVRASQSTECYWRAHGTLQRYTMRRKIEASIQRQIIFRQKHFYTTNDVVAAGLDHGYICIAILPWPQRKARHRNLSKLSTKHLRLWGARRTLTTESPTYSFKQITNSRYYSYSFWRSLRQVFVFRKSTSNRPIRYFVNLEPLGLWVVSRAL